MGFVDIYVREVNGSREIRFPVLPEDIQYDSGSASVATHDIMRKGPVDIPLGVGLKEVKFDSFFPGAKRERLSMQRGAYRTPDYYHRILEDWKAKGTDLTIIITNYPINFECYVADYKAKPAGGFGDLYFSVVFKEDETITIKSKTESSNAGGTSGDKESEENKRPAEQSKTYTIKKGDTMWEIAVKHLGNGTRWKEIYTANKAILDADAKKYGHASNNGTLIFPGTVIKIPAK